ncbi:hypothetical protein P4117_13755 [Pseudomonas aeruginosa]|nr:hypothetical protein [Pseudomonas aeruginosa]
MKLFRIIRLARRLVDLELPPAASGTKQLRSSDFARFGRIDMSKSLINEAVLTQVLNHLRNSQLRRCAEMGLRRRFWLSSNSLPSRAS